MFQIENGLIRFAGAAVCAAAGILFLLPFGHGIKNIGNVFGLFISALFFVYFGFNRQFSAMLLQMWKNTFGKIAVSSFTVILAAGFLSALIMSCFMIYKAADRPVKSGPAVLLGCKVNGTSPSLMLGRRLNAAYEYLEDNPDAYIVVSGGQGDGEDISEAQCMKNYLSGRGIAEERIIMEDKSTDTEENLKFSKALLDERNAGDQIVVITDSFHQLRASMIAGKLGIKTKSVSSETPVWLLPTYWVREWFGITEQIFFK